MLGNPGSYANKKRKKPVLKHKKVSDGSEVVKSNPSKRHRDRLNGELDRLTDLLPFSEEVRSRLDKLSVLRLSVGYLRVKSYFKAAMKTPNSSVMFPGVNGQSGSHMDMGGFSEGDLLLQALNGFVIVVTSDGSVFYVSPTIKDYLGFHQSDVVHQSVFELIHTDDRALFRQQLHFALKPADEAEDALQSCGGRSLCSPEQLPPENSSFLERSFVCRFRCLLDNSSGFLALKFQGRLKYLHGQRTLRDNGNLSQPQLALFSLAMPVQPPTIVEIRAKMLLFQSKHKLDFTPMGIDSRGKIILGYSETELCMKGSGYQFIHAADMMYCADNHIRMIKTGESGLTVFRLLSKSGAWVWVKANAKLIFKGGRPDFILAYQKALVNAEGEEYLRQRRLQLPFRLTTGEGLLYDTGPTVDVQQFQFNKMFSGADEASRDGNPRSLLDCFLRQDETAYLQPAAESPLPVDQVFMDSQALLSVASDSWQDSGSTSTSEPVVVKEEAKQSVMAVISSLEDMAQSGDFSAALQGLEVGDAELAEWENALKKLSQDEQQQSSVRSELDGVLASNIFDYIDSILFKEKGEDCPPSCLAAAGGPQHAFAPAGLPEPQLFPTPSPECSYSPTNGLFAPRQDAVNGSMLEAAQIFDGAPKLSHHPLIPAADAGLPPLQQLQLQDIFSPAIELPQLTVPPAAPLQRPTGHVGRPHGPAQDQQEQLLQGLQADLLQGLQADLLQGAQQPNSAAAGVMDMMPPLIPCSDFSPAGTPGVSVPYAACLQGSPPCHTLSPQAAPWPSQQHRLSHAGMVQNGHELLPACHSQAAESQTFPRPDLWPRGGAAVNHGQQGGVACGQAAAQSSCMFDQHFSSGPAGGDVLALSGPLAPRGAYPTLDQSPPQGSCYFQWGRSESVVGTSAISQEDVNISPLTVPPSMASAERALNMQLYLERHLQAQQNKASSERGGMFGAPAHDVAMFLAE